MTGIQTVTHFDKPPFTSTCINSIAEKILKKRYLIKNASGESLETPSEMFWRVAKNIAEAEYNYGASDGDVEKYSEAFYSLMATGKMQPNTPTLVNAGRDNGLSYSACFVLPIQDDLVKHEDSIYGTLRNMAAIHQSGGGTGFSFSNLRPKGSIVNSTSGVASGPISFMSLYDASTNVVKQGGTRRGANMGILRVDHPDIFEFITCKSNVTQITNFNISVAVTDKFMEAVTANDDFDLVDPKTKRCVKTIKARKLFDLITAQAHATGEPGLFFVDEANRHNPVPHLGSYEATNPCGEIPMLNNDTCNLGSININAYLKPYSEVEPEFAQGSFVIDYDMLEKDIDLAVRFIDNVIDQNNYPVQAIHDLSHKIRRIGLGVMGWADLLITLNISYRSTEAIDFAYTFMKRFNELAEDASEKLANERTTFSGWEISTWGPDETCAKDASGNRIRKFKKMRNCDVTMIAPTGTISIIANCSGGIEPLFAVAFSRNQAGSIMQDVNPAFLQIAKDEGWYSKELIDKIIDTGHINHNEIPTSVQDIFVTSHEITPEQHILMQAAFQAHTHQAISKTCNFPTEATVPEIEKAYILAYKTKCKGVTVYRDGSRPNQILSTGKTTEQPPVISPIKRKKRPEIVKGFTRQVEFAKLGKVYITVNTDDDDSMYEIFIQWGRAGSDETTLTEALGRILSTAVQWGIPPHELARSLKGIGGKTVVFHNGNTYSSIPDAVGKTISLALKRNGKDEDEKIKASVFTYKCPECKTDLLHAEGCDKCAECGFSSCG